MAESSSRTSLKAGTTKNNAEKYQNVRALSVQWDNAVCYNKSDTDYNKSDTEKIFPFRVEISGYYSKNVVVFGAKERRNSPCHKEKS